MSAFVPNDPTLPRDRPDRRLLAIGILLALSLVLGAILAISSIQSARQQRATVERALRDYAGFAAFILATHAYRALSDAAGSAFAGWDPQYGPPVPPGMECPGGVTFFEARDGRAPRYGGTPPSSAERAFLADTLFRDGGGTRLLAAAHWRLRFVAVPGTDAGYFVTRRGMLLGYRACFGGDIPGPSSNLFRAIMLAEPALPPAIAAAGPADSLYSMVVTAGGSTLYASPAARRSPYSGVARVADDLFGDLTIRVDLRPERADHLIVGGTPGSRAPMAVGLLALSVLLGIVALLQLRREQRLIAIRSAFVANVSHELRTPLSQILLFTELLRMDRLRSDGERRRALEVVDQEVRRLIGLVENVLRYSATHRGARPPAPGSVALDAEVASVVDAFGPLAGARRAQLRIDLEPGLVIQGDRSDLRQILTNLLDNAVKYGPEGQTVLLQGAAAGDRVRLTVTDQGPGIPAAERERVWEAYYRVPGAAGDSATGSGLGLAVVRGLVGEMRGQAWVDDAPDGGARFIVELPRKEGGV